MKSRCWDAQHTHAHTISLAARHKMATCPQNYRTQILKNMRESFTSTLRNPWVFGLFLLAVQDQRDASHPTFNSFWPPLGSLWDPRRILFILSRTSSTSRSGLSTVCLGFQELVESLLGEKRERGVSSAARNSSVLVRDLHKDRPSSDTTHMFFCIRSHHES